VKGWTDAPGHADYDDDKRGRVREERENEKVEESK
jgi:hypothetical protein